MSSIYSSLLDNLTTLKMEADPGQLYVIDKVFEEIYKLQEIESHKIEHEDVLDCVQGHVQDLVEKYFLNVFQGKGLQITYKDTPIKLAKWNNYLPILPSILNLIPLFKIEKNFGIIFSSKKIELKWINSIENSSRENINNLFNDLYNKKCIITYEKSSQFEHLHFYPKSNEKKFSIVLDKFIIAFDGNLRYFQKPIFDEKECLIIGINKNFETSRLKKKFLLKEDIVQLCIPFYSQNVVIEIPGYITDGKVNDSSQVIFLDLFDLIGT